MPLSKLSNKGWSYNRRVLLLTSDYLCYYSKVPANFKNDTTPEGKGKILPKIWIFIDYITSVGPITNKDFIKYKKKFNSPTLILKIVFLTAGLTKKGKELVKNVDKIKNANKWTEWYFLTDA